MLTAAVRRLLGQPGEAEDPVAPPDDARAKPPGPPDAGARPAAETNLWPADRLAVTNQLWGRGFILPGGDTEILHLIRPLGLTPSSSLVLIGGGGGGPAASIVANTGAWVTNLEVEPTLLAQAKAVVKAASIGNKVKSETWDSRDPQFARGAHHHCMAIEPLRHGGAPEPLIDALTQTVKANGQLVMIDLVADTPLPADDPDAGRWAEREARALRSIPTQNAVTRTMTRLGFDVRVVEDISSRHIRNAMIGWRAALRELEDDQPPPILAAQMIAEAELWLYRVRLLRHKRLRLMRWHAIGRGAAAAGRSPGRR